MEFFSLMWLVIGLWGMVTGSDTAEIIGFVNSAVWAAAIALTKEMKN